MSRPPWQVDVRSELGLVRDEMQDAYAILFDAPHAGRLVHAVAVFDGLGGVPEGRAAARAAADALPKALAEARAATDVLALLNRSVVRTGGATTAVIAMLPVGTRDERGTVLSVGDSGAYALRPDGRVAGLVPRDRAAPNVLLDYLGRPGPQGHEFPLRVPPGTALLLCTDGADDVVGPEGLAALLRAPGQSVDREFEALFQEIRNQGAPDNATVLLARRAP